MARRDTMPRFGSINLLDDQIAAAKVLISGAVGLDDWRNAVDPTKVDGADVYAASLPRSAMTAETVTIPVPHSSIVDDTEALIGIATAPKHPTYDTVLTGQLSCDTKTGAGTITNIFWAIVRLPTSYVDAGNLTLKIDGLYTLGGDAVLVAATIGLEAYAYDAVAGDFSNADICATAAQALALALATKSFTVTGTTLTANGEVLLRFTSVINITSAGGVGTGVNGFNNLKVEFSGRM